MNIREKPSIQPAFLRHFPLKTNGHVTHEWRAELSATRGSKVSLGPEGKAFIRRMLLRRRYAKLD